eukprot:1198670-Rhodomonas_salina.3
MTDGLQRVPCRNSKGVNSPRSGQCECKTSHNTCRRAGFGRLNRELERTAWEFDSVGELPSWDVVPWRACGLPHDRHHLLSSVVLILKLQLIVLIRCRNRDGPLELQEESDVEC